MFYEQLKTHKIDNYEIMTELFRSSQPGEYQMKLIVINVVIELVNCEVI